MGWLKGTRMNKNVKQNEKVEPERKQYNSNIRMKPLQYHASQLGYPNRGGSSTDVVSL